MIDGYQLEVCFSNERGSCVGFNAFLVGTKKLKILDGSPMMEGSVFHDLRSIIPLFYRLVDLSSTILSVHDRALGLSTIHDHALGLCLPQSCVSPRFCDRFTGPCKSVLITQPHCKPPTGPIQSIKEEEEEEEEEEEDHGDHSTV